MKKIFRISLLLSATVLVASVSAKEYIGSNNNNSSKEVLKMKFGSDCDPATQSADLDVNNVRTKILNGGDMWWDLSSARYEVPKIDDLNSVRKHSVFAGAIWIGGEDLGGNLRLAAMTYRQRGSDFWPGPLDPITSNTNSSVCNEYDKIWKVDGSKIIAHSEEFVANGAVLNPDVQIDEWPGKRLGDQISLAPFKDVDGNGYYEPENGDYPVLKNDCDGDELENEASDQPDQMLWWVYNDKGNIHSESQGVPIGVELQTTAFAFATNDEINDMTFYTTRIINRGFNQLKNTYFGQWVDADLGNYADDYVGCDVELSLGFCYNGDDNDEGVLGYGLNPPSVGVDFFEGPLVDTTIGGVDQQIELGMSRFVYYNNNNNPINGSPIGQAANYYNYMRGKWKNGADMEYGGDGVTNTDGTIAKYMFPFESDPDHNEFWSEGDWRGTRNQPADRRFIQSSGPFVLEPGAVQRLTVGVVWARSSFGGAEGSLNLLREASKKAQALFNSCFDLVDGPDAPDVEVQELDQQLVLSLGNTNSKRVENYKDTVLNGLNQEEYYSFQGYRVFQLKDGSVSLSDLDDISKAREVFQCDLIDDYDVLTNQEFSADVSANIPVLKIRGENEGLSHSVSITQDEFATGSNKTLVNFKTYYYIVLSYAAGLSADNPYLEGRKVIEFSASPRKTEPRFSGSNAQSYYGDGPELIRMSGLGNGGNFLNLKPESDSAILKDNYAKNPIYENAHGPVKVTVIDPLKVPEGDFELTLLENNVSQHKDGLRAENTKWILVKLPNDTIFSDTTIAYENEQIILESTTGNKIFDWGLAVTLTQVSHPGVNPQTGNGLVGWEVEFDDPSQEWLTALRDNDAPVARQFGMFDWIRSGTQGRIESPAYGDPSWHDYAKGGESLDPQAVYEKIWDGRVAPFRLTSFNPPSNPTPDRPATLVQGIGYGFRFFNTMGLDRLSSVDLVITADESKWSECVMLESGEDPGLTEGGVQKFDLRTGTMMNDATNSPVVFDGSPLAPGKTVFPGYAINLETGERLNIIVTEDSYLREENGRDMKWNPTDDISWKGSYPRLGGRHYIYIMGSHEGIHSSYHPKMNTYDKGNQYYNELISASSQSQKDAALTKIFQNCDWVVPTYLVAGYELKDNGKGVPVPPTDFRMKLRVEKPYQYNESTGDVNDGNPKYKFSTKDIYNEISVENGKNALDLINVVPNPYYAFAGAPGYESSPLDNQVKFTNLPEKCDISIYTLDGQLVRRIKKDDELTEVKWNIKNSAAVPVASGLYIIHVDAGELGEKVLKWMGIMRQLDLDSF
jgi:hypothetical protein